MTRNPFSLKVELPCTMKMSFDSTDDAETRRRSFSNAPTKNIENFTQSNTYDNETFFYLFEQVVDLFLLSRRIRRKTSFEI